MFLVIGKDDCSYCAKVKELLKSKSEMFVYKNLSDIDSEEKNYLKTLIKEDLKLETVPVVLHIVGGYEATKYYIAGMK